MSAAQLALTLDAPGPDAWARELGRILDRVPEVMVVAVLPGPIACAYLLVDRRAPAAVHTRVAAAAARADRARPAGSTAIRIGGTLPNDARVVWRRD